MNPVLPKDITSVAGTAAAEWPRALSLTQPSCITLNNM